MGSSLYIQDSNMVRTILIDVLPQSSSGRLFTEENGYAFFSQFYSAFSGYKATRVRNVENAIYGSSDPILVLCSSNMNCLINSSSPSATYTRQWIG